MTPYQWLAFAKLAFPLTIIVVTCVRCTRLWWARRKVVTS